MLVSSDENAPRRNHLRPWTLTIGRDLSMADRAPKPKPELVQLSPLHRHVEKPWGWEVIWAEGADYTGKLIHVLAGRRLSLQYHESKTETQCLLSGCAMLIVEDAEGQLSEISMQPGVGYTVTPFQLHRLVAVEDSDIVEVSTPERGVTVRVDDDYRRSDETEEMRAEPQRGWTPRVNGLPRE
jgi:mannose-6-phosphate isomerase